MTADQARIVLLVQELDQAASTIEFMHGCSTAPETYRYSYPGQAVARLARIRALAPERRVCVHSFTDPDCPGCQDRIEYFQARALAYEVLGITDAGSIAAALAGTDAGHEASTADQAHDQSPQEQQPPPGAKP